MFDQIRIAAQRSRDTLLTDTIGAVSLIVMLIAALHLPGLA